MHLVVEGGVVVAPVVQVHRVLVHQEYPGRGRGRGGGEWTVLPKDGGDEGAGEAEEEEDGRVEDEPDEVVGQGKLVAAPVDSAVDASVAIQWMMWCPTLPWPAGRPWPSLRGRDS